MMNDMRFLQPVNRTRMDKITGISENDVVDAVLKQFGNVSLTVGTNDPGNNVPRSFYTKDDFDRRDIRGLNDILTSSLQPALDPINIDICPMVITTQTFFSTTDFELEHTLPAPTPPLGTTRQYRMITNEVVSRSKRYGIGAFMEGDMLNTPQGQKMLAMFLVAFKRSEADNFAYMAYAKLILGDPRHQFASAFSRQITYNEYIQYLRTERDQTCIFNKSTVGIHKCVAYHSDAMTRESGVIPEVAIGPASKMRHLMTTGNRQMFDYSRAGSPGVQALNADWREIGIVGGVVIRESPINKLQQGFHIDYPEVRSREVYLGEYAYCGKYPGIHEDSDSYGVYDVTTDTVKWIKFEELFRNSGYFIELKRGDTQVPDKDGQLVEFKYNDTPIKAPCDGWYLNQPLIESVLGENRFTEQKRPSGFFTWGQQVAAVGGGNNRQMALQALDDAQNAVDEAQAEVDAAAANDVARVAANARLTAAQTALQVARATFSAIRDNALVHMEQVYRTGGTVFTPDDTNQLEKVVHPIIQGGVNNKWLLDPKYIVPNIPGFDFSIEAWRKSKLIEHQFFRPMNGYYMNDLILLRRYVGWTYRSDSGIQFGNDVGARSNKIEWRGEGGVHIAKWPWVRPVRNVSYDGYISGGNAKVMTQGEARVLQENGYRLADMSSPSGYSICIPAGTFDCDTELIHLLGETRYRKDVIEYSEAEVYRKLYGWESHVNIDGEVPGAENLCPLAQVLFRSSISYMMQNNSIREVEGKTHHGPREGPGCEKVRRTGQSIIPRPED